MSTYFLGNGQVVLGTLKRSNKLFKRTLPRATPGGKLRLRSHDSVRIFDRLKRIIRNTFLIWNRSKFSLCLTEMTNQVEF